MVQKIIKARFTGLYTAAQLCITVSPAAEKIHSDGMDVSAKTRIPRKTMESLEGECTKVAVLL